MCRRASCPKASNTTSNSDSVGRALTDATGSRTTSRISPLANNQPVAYAPVDEASDTASTKWSLERDDLISEPLEWLPHIAGTVRHTGRVCVDRLRSVEDAATADTAELR